MPTIITVTIPATIRKSRSRGREGIRRHTESKRHSVVRKPLRLRKLKTQGIRQENHTVESLLKPALWISLNLYLL